MASLTRGTTIDWSDTCYASTLHALIENAIVSNVVQSDLENGCHFITVQSSAPNPTNSPIWFDTNPLDPVLRIWAEPFGIWLTVGPDRMEIPLKNGYGGPVHKGALVSISSFSQFTMASTPSINAIGLLQDTAASGAWAPVMIYGIGYGAFQSSVSGVGGDNVCTANYFMASYGNRPGYCHGIASNGESSGSNTLHGVWLESRSGTGLARCLFYGPKVVY